VDGLWATKSKGVGLIVRVISFQDVVLIHHPLLSQTDGQTDGQMTCNCSTGLCTIVHRTVKMLAPISPALSYC